jgi:ubiquinone/menaquinone biosynthesis C-methylase UbiE
MGVKESQSVNQSVQDQFGRVAENYAASFVHKQGPDLDAMLEQAALLGDERVLDVGCGTGHTTLAFAARAREIEGLDLTEAMLEQGRRMAEERGIANLRFRRGDVEALPYPDTSFDLVTSRFSAHHYAHAERALREIARVLKRGGTLLLADSVAPEEAAQDTFFNAIEVLRDPSHVRNHSVSQWRRMLTEAGFEADLLGRWPLTLDFEDWVKRMRTPALAVSQLRATLAGATREIQRAFAIGEKTFTIPTALLRGRMRTS